MSDREILHCDLDNFFASVETFYRPELGKVPMAVCGSEEERHGIVLAKNQLAKQYGVKTAQAIWQAKQLCPSLVTVEPHYDRYVEFSRRARAVYDSYTDMVEPFGIDECWLDVTGSRLIFGSGEDIARQINRRIKEEIGITVSVGVSFNKCFSKLGSDLNKPDGVTLITRENFKDTVWGLPVQSLLWVGKSTLATLQRLGIYTIGDICRTRLSVLEAVLGKNGKSLYANAMGMDASPVIRESEQPPAKSIGKSVTGREDLKSDLEVYRVLLGLCEEVSEKLRSCSLLAGGIQIHIRDSMLVCAEKSMKLERPTRLAKELANEGFRLFKSSWQWHRQVRSIGIRATRLVCDGVDFQLEFDYDYSRAVREERLEESVDLLRKRYGRQAVVRAALL